ncbi:hypothetical protein VCSRO70_3178 [Vibrio cholerae]|nr:putative O-antigen polymerase [Vibrio cholerae]GHY51467.1 hypothetical protein VCSRO70_3178 [Vibrio cholerae]
MTLSFCQRRNISLSLIGLLFSLGMVLYPLLMLLLMLLTVPLMNFSDKLLKLFFCTIPPLFFAAINTLKFPASDLLVYINAIEVIDSLNILEVFSFKYVSLRSTEFIFNIYIWIISIFDKTGWLFSFLSVYIVYLNVSIALCNIFSVRKKELLYLFLGMLLFSLTFTLVGHLVRQYLAGSVFLLGLSYLNKRDRLGVFFIVLSSLIHNSLAAFVLTLPFAKLLLSKEAWLRYTILIFIFSYIISSFSHVLMPYMEIGFVKDDGDIPLVLIIFDCFLFILFAWLRIKNNKVVISTEYIYIFAVILVSCLIVSKDIMLVFFRFYFLVDFIRPFVIASLTVVLVRSGLVGIYIFLTLCLSMFIFAIRFDSSPWDYGGDAFSLLFNNDFIDVVNRYSDVWFSSF